MSWLTNWFRSGPGTAEKVLDSAVRGIDKIFFTAEEKADAQQKLGDTWVAVQKILVQETSIQAVTRRILAVLVFIPYILMTLATAVVYPFNQEYAKFLLELANGQFGWLVLGVGAFYFGPYMIGRMLDKKK